MKWLVLAMALILSVITSSLLNAAYEPQLLLYVVEYMFTGLIIAVGLMIIEEHKK